MESRSAMESGGPLRFSSPHIFWTEQTRQAFEKAISTGWISISENMNQLEKVCQELFGVAHVIACSSATQGLAIALRAAGWTGIKVGLPSFTWPSTLYALQVNNCRPVFADIDPETWLMEVDSLPETVDACLPVDTFGNQWSPPGDLDVPLIIDAAHGFGLPRLGKRGVFEVVSMSHTKIPTAGEGGLILTADRKLAEEATELRRLAARMSEFSAIIGLESIRQYPQLAAARKRIIDQYDRELKIDKIRQRVPEATSRSVYALRIRDLELKKCICAKLAEHQIEFKTYYDPLHAGLPETDLLYREILCLPVYPKIQQHLSFIVELVNSCG